MTQGVGGVVQGLMVSAGATQPRGGTGSGQCHLTPWADGEAAFGDDNMFDHDHVELTMRGRGNAATATEFYTSVC